MDTLFLSCLIVAVISSLCALIIIVSFRISKKSRNTATKLLYLLSISDLLFYSGSFLGSPSESSPLCHIQAFLLTMFQLSSAAWSICIAIVLPISYRQSRRHTNIHRSDPDYFFPSREALFHFFSWGIPIVLSVISLAGEKLGSVDNLPLCGIKYRISRFFLQDIWLLGAWFVCLIFTILSSRRRHVHINSSPWIYHYAPLVFCCLWFVPLVIRIATAEPSVWVAVVEIVLCRLQGVLNASGWMVKEAKKKKVPVPVEQFSDEEGISDEGVLNIAEDEERLSEGEEVVGEDVSI